MSFTYDGYDLTRYALSRIERPVGPQMRVTSETVPGRAGEIVSDCSPDVLHITAHMTLRKRYINEWDRVRRELAAALTKTSKRVLTLPDESDLWRYATASLLTNVTTPLTPPVEFDIEFVCHDPVAYSDEHSVTVPSGGSVSMSVGGTMPAIVSVSAASAVRDSTTNLWGLQIDSGDVLHLELPTSDAQSVTIDCSNRVARVSDALTMATLDSFWPTLDPGEHTVSMDKGTGAATITWTERWL